jgi:CO dehydrogenase nickel-insertion accessory protein CooC1
MARDLCNLVFQLHHGGLPATEHLPTPHLVELARGIYRDSRVRRAVVVLNRIPDEDTEQVLRDDLLDFGVVPVAAIYEDPAIATSWYRGNRLQSTAASADIESLMAALQGAAASAPTPESKPVP